MSVKRGHPRECSLSRKNIEFSKVPPYLRVAIVLLVQTGGRTYSEGLTLRWDQVDPIHGVLHLGGSVKTTDSAQPLPLSRLACDVLKEWKKEQGSERSPGKPIRNVKRAWRTALKRAGVPYFPITICVMYSARG